MIGFIVTLGIIALMGIIFFVQKRRSNAAAAPGTPPPAPDPNAEPQGWWNSNTKNTLLFAAGITLLLIAIGVMFPAFGQAMLDRWYLVASSVAAIGIGIYLNTQGHDFADKLRTIGIVVLVLVILSGLKTGIWDGTTDSAGGFWYGQSWEAKKAERDSLKQIEVLQDQQKLANQAKIDSLNYGYQVLKERRDGRASIDVTHFWATYLERNLPEIKMWKDTFWLAPGRYLDHEKKLGQEFTAKFKNGDYVPDVVYHATERISGTNDFRQVGEAFNSKGCFNQPCGSLPNTTTYRFTNVGDDTVKIALYAWENPANWTSYEKRQKPFLAQVWDAISSSVTADQF